MKKWEDIVLTIIFTLLFIILLGGVIFWPVIKNWLYTALAGLRGALILYGIGIALFAYFAFFMEYRGRSLIYCLLLIIFAFSCIWLIFNFEMFSAFLEQHLGVWGMTGVLLVLSFLVWLGMKFLNL